MIRAATLEDIAYVLCHIRAQDRREIEEATGRSYGEAVTDLLVGKPHVAFVIGDDQRPVAILGAMVDHGSKTASMFRFATNLWPKVVREVIRFGRRDFPGIMRDLGVRHVYAQTLKDGDTAWMRLFGAKRVHRARDFDEREKFKLFCLDLAPAP